MLNGRKLFDEERIAGVGKQCAKFFSAKFSFPTDESRGYFVKVSYTIVVYFFNPSLTEHDGVHGVGVVSHQSVVPAAVSQHSVLIS